jgi:hypothetical protein
VRTVGELVRSLKANPQRVDPVAAGKVLAQAAAEGSVSPAERQELADLLGSAPSDGFAPELKDNMARFLQGTGARPTVPVAQLVDLEKLPTPRAVADRLGPDFVLLRDQLLPAQGTPKERAARLSDFLAAYAERFVGLHSGEAKAPQKQSPNEVLDFRPVKAQPTANPERPQEGPKWPGGAAKQAVAPERREDLKRFGKALEDSGFRGLRDGRTGKDGVAVGVQLAASANLTELRAKLQSVRLELSTTSALAQAHVPFADAPVARPVVQPARELGESAQVAKDRVQPEAMRVQPWQAEAGRVVIVPVAPQARDARPDGQPMDPRASSGRVLGKNMLWNWLHTFREGAADDPEQKAAAQQLAVGAALVLFALTIVALALVTL